MRSIDSYDSRYPSEYYEIGTVYSFYGSSNAGNLKPAEAEYISKYSAKLLELQEEEKTSAIKAVDASSSSSSFSTFQRFYGIVVAKPQNKFIKIMLISEHDGKSDYFTKEYAVNHSGCTLDGKEVMSVSSSAKYDGVSENSVKKVGGITRADSTTNVGGITRAKPNDNSAAGVGGITRSNKSSVSVPSTKPNTSNTSSNNVGGITRVKNVGGITRVKK